MKAHAIALALCCLVLAWPRAVFAENAVVYVDADGCPAAPDGSSEAPWCTLEEALVSSAIRPGTSIRLRDADVPYAGALATGISGTADAPVVLEPDIGHAPIVEGMVELDGCSHWTLQGLTFDAGSSTVLHAVLVTGASTNISIVGNRIRGYGDVADSSSAAISVRGDDHRLAYNEIRDCVRDGIRFQDAANTRIEHNRIHGMLCGGVSTDSRASHRGIASNQASPEPVIRYNWISDFVEFDCPTTPNDADVAGISLRGSDGAVVSYNLVERIPHDLSAGINVRPAVDAIVHHNIIKDIGGCGICTGKALSGGPQGLVIASNTIVRTAEGIRTRPTTEQTDVLHNIIADARVVHIRAGEVELGRVDGNLYYPGEAGGAIAQQGAELDFAEWQALGYDVGSPEPANPLFDTRLESLTPAVGSPAVDAGTNSPVPGATFHGDATDLGALEAPRLVAALIDASDPTKITIDVENNVAPPLALGDGCAGFEIRADGDVLPTGGCTMEASTLLQVSLPEPVCADAAVEVRYSGGPVVDSASVGGFIGALLADAVLDVVNGSLQVCGVDETGTASTAGTGTGIGTGSETSVGSDFPDDPDACQCTAGSRPRAALFLALLFLARRRARSA